MIARRSKLLMAAAALAVASPSARAGEPPGLHAALERLSREGRFSGAVVVRDASGVRFARGYGPADPFTDRRFTPDTPVDSASLAKPVTAAAILVLARDRKIDLDAHVRRYLPEYPHEATTIRHLLAHSAGLPFDDSPEALVGKSNAGLLAAVGASGTGPLFPPGTGFDYCNLCYATLALLIERVAGMHYLDFVRKRVALPPGVTLRPASLARWKGRAIGYRRSASGRLDPADSYDGEVFYGTANFSISAAQLARWGSEWWKPQLAPLGTIATTAARIAGRPSGLTWGNWYCAPRGQRCHYLGHHEGFHHMLFWDRERKLSIAMVSNNSVAPALQQRLQRALVSFAAGRPRDGERELQAELADTDVAPGAYALTSGDRVFVNRQGSGTWVERGGIRYRAYRIGKGIRYVPGLDAYVAGAGNGRLRWLSLYEDELGMARSSRG